MQNKQNLWDISHKFKRYPLQFPYRTPFYTRYLCYRISNNQIQYMFSLDGLCSKFRPFIRTYYFAKDMIHEEDELTLSDYLITMIKSWNKKLVQMGFKTSDEILDMLLGARFIKQHQKSVKIIQGEVEYVQRFDPQQSIIAKQMIKLFLSTENGDNEAYNQQSFQNITQVIQKKKDCVNTYEDIWSTMRALNPQEIQKHKLAMLKYQFYMRKLVENFEQKLFPESGRDRMQVMQIMASKLQKMYNFTVTMSNNLESEDKVIYLISDIYDTDFYKQKGSNRSIDRPKDEVQCIKIGRKLFKDSQQVFNVCSLIQILSKQAQSTSKKSYKQYLRRRMEIDIAKELIQYYLLTGYEYPDPNIINIMFNTRTHRFYLDVEPIILEASGFDIRNRGLPEIFSNGDLSIDIEMMTYSFYEAFRRSGRGGCTDNAQILRLSLHCFDHQLFSPAKIYLQEIPSQWVIPPLFTIQSYNGNVSQFVEADNHSKYMCWLRYMITNLIEKVIDSHVLHRQGLYTKEFHMFALMRKCLYIFELYYQTDKQESLHMSGFSQIFKNSLEAIMKLSGPAVLKSLKFDNQNLTEKFTKMWVKIKTYLIYLQKRQPEQILHLINLNDLTSQLAPFEGKLTAQSTQINENQVHRYLQILLYSLLEKINEDNAENIHYLLLPIVTEFDGTFKKDKGYEQKVLAQISLFQKILRQIQKRQRH